jgi:hypothetical protein
MDRLLTRLEAVAAAEVVLLAPSSAPRILPADLIWLGRQLGEHVRREVDAMYPDAALAERQRDAAGSDPEFQGWALDRQPARKLTVGSITSGPNRSAESAS